MQLFKYLFIDLVVGADKFNTLWNFLYILVFWYAKLTSKFVFFIIFPKIDSWVRVKDGFLIYNIKF